MKTTTVKAITIALVIAIVGIGAIALTFKLQERASMSETKTYTKLPSGLKYIILKEGNGPSPKKGQMVTVHYTGRLDNQGKEGKKFDSSLDRAKPFTFLIGNGQVIKGWDQGVMLMKIGEKRRLIIPSELGYGSYGIPGIIPGGATLIFDVELLDVK
ncbi:MAG TPA: FKBP-type peptidyl-prolyl cis-trans isomerase [Candidatus Babeliaceae bacterium]|nr:FKBP-type peptidyl-prolyl cis-trans isomerase [Candidatus Babeliaceae bacterium]